MSSSDTFFLSKIPLIGECFRQMRDLPLVSTPRPNFLAHRNSIPVNHQGDSSSSYRSRVAPLDVQRTPRHRPRTPRRRYCFTSSYVVCYFLPVLQGHLTLYREAGERQQTMQLPHFLLSVSCRFHDRIPRLPELPANITRSLTESLNTRTDRTQLGYPCMLLTSQRSGSEDAGASI